MTATIIAYTVMFWGTLLVLYVLPHCQPQSMLLSSWKAVVTELANQVSCTQLTWLLFKLKGNPSKFVLE